MEDHRHVPDLDDYMRDLPDDPFRPPEERRRLHSLFPWAAPGAVPAPPVVPSVVRGRTLTELPPDPGRFFESCPLRGVISVIAGACGWVGMCLCR